VTVNSRSSWSGSGKEHRQKHLYVWQENGIDNKYYGNASEIEAQMPLGFTEKDEGKIVKMEDPKPECALLRPQGGREPVTEAEKVLNFSALFTVLYVAGLSLVFKLSIS
jgi:hypothetical protein